MKLNKLSIISFFAIIMPVVSLADHDCIEGIDAGNKIKIEKNFPEDWLTIGGKLITDQKLHSDLHSKFKDYCTIGEGKDDEGYTGYSFRAQKDGIYISISTAISETDTQSHAKFSLVAPKCWKCKKISKGIEYLTSKIGLKIGQNKSDVSKILGLIIKEDITTISFEEIIKGELYTISHSQDLRLVFRTGRLIRFSISDYRERYN